MLARDVVQKLAIRLPRFSDKFTTNKPITALTQVAGVATAACVAHGLSVGSQVNIQNAKTPIAVSSLTRSGVLGTMVVSNPHDLTRGFSEDVEFTGAVEPEFNGVFPIVNVVDRYTVTFLMADAGPTTATGSPLLLNGSNYFNSYNGLRAVATVPDADHFTFSVPASIYPTAYGTISARTLPRISAALNEDLIIDAYTKQATNEYWAFVVLGDVVASKDRNTNTDATSNVQRGEHFRVQLIQPVTLYVVIPAASDMAGRSARDAAEELLQPVCQSILMAKFDSKLASGSKNPLQFVGHGFAAYNKAVYIHAYQFAAVADMQFEDTVGHDEDVAFRDIDLQVSNDLGTGVIQTAAIALDA